MSDQPTTPPPAQDDAATPHDEGGAPLSHAAEDVLAHAVGHELEFEGDSSNPEKNVKEVLSSMVDNKEELAITLEYGTGESGVDQASWEIEVTTLQRAYMRKQMHDEVDVLAKQIDDELRVVKGCIDGNWIEQTREFRSLMKLFEQPSVTRQEVDDFQHRIFGRDAYLNYLEAVLSVKDIRKLLNAVGNLKQVSQQLEEDYNALIDPSKVDYNALSDAIIEAEGDIDALSIELERDYSSAVFRRNVGLAEGFAAVINEEFLKAFKLWAHSFDLNIREVLATEKSATNGPITEKSRDQLKDMLLSGSEQINRLLQVVQ